MRVIARVAGRELVLEVARAEDGHAVSIAARDRAAPTDSAAPANGPAPADGAASAEAVAQAHGAGPFRAITVGGRAVEACAWRTSHAGQSGEPDAWDVLIGGRVYPVLLTDPLRPGDTGGRAAAGAGPAAIRAVMPGKVVTVLAGEGTEVLAGQGLVVVEAMKMENEITAPRAGRVAEVKVRPGEVVEAGAILIVLGPLAVDA
jgi:3-methylcrotonyl-CoA carboxylase alpha subunit